MKQMSNEKNNPNQVTEEMAIEVARQHATLKEWLWETPVNVKEKNGPGGARCYEIYTNAEKRGCNIRVLVAKESGEVIESYFLPR